MSRNSKFFQHFDASRLDFTPYGFTCELWSPQAMPRSDRHNEIELNFLTSGSLTYLLGGKRETVEHGRLTVFWAALPHQILTYETCQPYHVVTLPLASFLSCRFLGDLIRPVLEGRIVTDPKPSAHDAPAFRRWFDDLQSGNLLRERAAELEIHARLLRLALALPAKRMRAKDASYPSATDPNLSRADQLACYIARHYMKPLTAD
ncbi:MAG: AraC family transcriptional regulator, partial [Rhodospirillales bacterium]|nr:AraC family transcriptional regulator [Acetobacter sp.]